MFSGKHILLGVTGSIAAYKAAVLTRSLVKEGAEVKVVMTPLAKQFITPLTMATLSRHPILVDFFNPENGGVEQSCEPGNVGRPLPNRARHGQHHRENGPRNRRQPAVDMLSVGTLPCRSRSGHGPRHVRPPHNAGEHRKTAEPRRTHHRTGLRRAGERPDGKGSHGRTGRNHRTGARAPSPDHVAPRQIPHRYGRPDHRAAGPRTLSLQPLLREDGLCDSRRTRRPRGACRTRERPYLPSDSGRHRTHRRTLRRRDVPCSDGTFPAGGRRRDVRSSGRLYSCGGQSDKNQERGRRNGRPPETHEGYRSGSRPGEGATGCWSVSHSKRTTSGTTPSTRCAARTSTSSCSTPYATKEPDSPATRTKITVIDRQGHTDEYPLEAKTAAAERIADRIEAWFAAVPEKR